MEEGDDVYLIDENEEQEDEEEDSDSELSTLEFIENQYLLAKMDDTLSLDEAIEAIESLKEILPEDTSSHRMQFKINKQLYRYYLKKLPVNYEILIECMRRVLSSGYSKSSIDSFVRFAIVQCSRNAQLIMSIVESVEECAPILLEEVVLTWLGKAFDQKDHINLERFLRRLEGRNEPKYQRTIFILQVADHYINQRYEQVASLLKGAQICKDRPLIARILVESLVTLDLLNEANQYSASNTSVDSHSIVIERYNKVLRYLTRNSITDDETALSLLFQAIENQNYRLAKAFLQRFGQQLIFPLLFSSKTYSFYSRISDIVEALNQNSTSAETTKYEIACKLVPMPQLFQQKYFRFYGHFGYDIDAGKHVQLVPEMHAKYVIEDGIVVEHDPDSEVCIERFTRKEIVYSVTVTGKTVHIYNNSQVIAQYPGRSCSIVYKNIDCFALHIYNDSRRALYLVKLGCDTVSLLSEHASIAFQREDMLCVATHHNNYVTMKSVYPLHIHWEFRSREVLFAPTIQYTHPLSHCRYVAVLDSLVWLLNMGNLLVLSLRDGRWSNMNYAGDLFSTTYQPCVTLAKYDPLLGSCQKNEWLLLLVRAPILQSTDIYCYVHMKLQHNSWYRYCSRMLLLQHRETYTDIAISTTA